MMDSSHSVERILNISRVLDFWINLQGATRLVDQSLGLVHFRFGRKSADRLANQEGHITSIILLPRQPAAVGTNSLESVPVRFGMLICSRDLHLGSLNINLSVVQFAEETLDLNLGTHFFLCQLTQLLIQCRFLSLRNSEVCRHLLQLLAGGLNELVKLRTRCIKAGIIRLELCHFGLCGFYLQGFILCAQRDHFSETACDGLFESLDLLIIPLVVSLKEAVAALHLGIFALQIQILVNENVHSGLELLELAGNHAPQLLGKWEGAKNLGELSRSDMLHALEAANLGLDFDLCLTGQTLAIQDGLAGDNVLSGIACLQSGDTVPIDTVGAVDAVGSLNSLDWCRNAGSVI
ncbi:uncharacterized protein N7503_007329 [Penicillium pulvis]|uniref:uncharacterized protein n=1 Tax=Penicillium pulvis TaxID=1562058 RepID=UPI002549731F|nr:uncharacterized protein N7503_007329 [Penicillium pulvis]KAJ5798033.1 hypothetical protein N7503_007329 [Penicillium pulvis]